MKAAESVAGQESQTGLPKIDQIAVDYVARFCAVCDQVALWQHEKMVKGNPTPEELEENRKGFKWVLRLARLVHSVAADPEFPDQALKKNIEGQIWRLEEYWKMIYQPMDQAEADQLLQEVFPDEPRA